MSAPRVILIEASPRRADDGTALTVRLAGGGGLVPYHYGGNHWRAGVTALPSVVTSLSYPGDDLGTGSMPQALSFSWSPATRAALDDLAALYWADAPISLYLGTEGAGIPPLLLTGRVLDNAVDPGALQIAMADPAADLKRPLLVDRFAGTGGAEGPVEWKGRIRRRAWGPCFNVVGDLIDKAHLIHCFGDPARAWQAFDAVRVRGAPVASGVLTLLAWQGSVATTFAALQAAAVPDGGGVLCPSIACIKWWTDPGILTADIRGENAGGYVATAPQIAQRMVAARSAIPFAAGTVAAASAARPAAYGWLADDESQTVATLLDKMLGDVSLSWALRGGQISIRRWEWTAPVASGHSQEVRRTKVHKPVGARRLGYQSNNKVMARGDLAGIVLAGDVVFDNGDTLSGLKPAEPGADKTSNNTAADTAKVSGKLSGVLLDELTLAGELGLGAENFVLRMEGPDPVTGFMRATVMVDYQGIARASQSIVAGPGGSVIGWMADEFYWYDSNGGAPRQAGKIVDGRWTMWDVYIDKLEVNSVITKSVSPFAISQGTQAQQGAAINCDPSDWQTAVSYNFVVPAGEEWRVTCITSGYLGFPDGDKSWNLDLLMDGSVVQGGGGMKTADFITLSGQRTFSTGTYAILLRVKGHGSVVCSQQTINVFWLKR